MTPGTTDDGLSIEQVARLTGVPRDLLRQWGQDHGWPTPHRHPNGYSVYPRGMVPLIAKLAQLVQDGHSAAELIVDGVPVWPAPKATTRAAWSRFDQLPRASDVGAEAFRSRLVGALRRHHCSAVIHMLHEASIVLRPGDRLVAAWLPAYFGAREWQREGRPLARDVGEVIRRVAGAKVLADVQARWLTADCIG